MLISFLHTSTVYCTSATNSKMDSVVLQVLINYFLLMSLLRHAILTLWNLASCWLVYCRDHSSLAFKHIYLNSSCDMQFSHISNWPGVFLSITIWLDAHNIIHLPLVCLAEALYWSIRMCHMKYVIDLSMWQKSSNKGNCTIPRWMQERN